MLNDQELDDLAFQHERRKALLWWRGLTETERVRVWEAGYQRFSFPTFCDSEAEIRFAYLRMKESEAEKASKAV